MELSYVDLLARVGEVNRPPGGKQTIRRIARRLGIGPSTRVLEIGCNTGFTSIELVKITGCSSIGVDINEAVVDEARKWRSRLRHGLGERVRFEVGDACALPFQDEQFDVVVCGGANTFIDDMAAAFSEYRRVLRPYGFLSITNLFYRSDPPAELRARLCDVLGFDVPMYGLTDWIHALTPPDWEIYYLSTSDLTRRAARVVDAYAETVCGQRLRELPERERRRVVDQWRRAVHVFNDNHGYLSYFELALRKDDEPEQAELFLLPGRYDHFFENAIVSAGRPEEVRGD